MTSMDHDEKLLAALRGHSVPASDDAESDDLAFAARIGRAARAAANEGDTELYPPVTVPKVHADEGTTRSPRRLGSSTMFGLAAALALIVAIGAVLISNLDDDPDVLAEVSLTVLDDTDTDGWGNASVLQDDDSRQLRVDFGGIDSGSGYLEVWLLDPDVTQLISLGPVRPDGRYEIPDGLNLSELPVVDVSVEPIDGVPTHSGQSVLRGALDI